MEVSIKNLVEIQIEYLLLVPELQETLESLLVLVDLEVRLKLLLVPEFQETLVLL